MLRELERNVSAAEIERQNEAAEEVEAKQAIGPNAGRQIVGRNNELGPNAVDRSYGGYANQRSRGDSGCGAESNSTGRLRQIEAEALEVQSR